MNARLSRANAVLIRTDFTFRSSREFTLVTVAATVVEEAKT
jgi:hypothetical protein